MSARADLEGKRFGRLLVTSLTSTDKSRVAWECLCDCGKCVVLKTMSLTSGNTRSCGCLKSEEASRRFTKHGHSHRSREYGIWSLMRDRCNNPHNKSFPYYGGRGIKVCARWDDFSAFLSDMGASPAKHTLDRIEGDKGYYPENCRWASRLEQARNRDYCRVIEYMGEKAKLVDIADRNGIPVSRVHNRLAKGWTPHRALTQQVTKR